MLTYGLLAEGRTRAFIRRGGPAVLAQRLQAGELATDFGPRAPHPTAGVDPRRRAPAAGRLQRHAAGRRRRSPQAKEIAALVREGGAEGLPGLRAIGLELARAGEIQISMNVERPDLTPLHAVVAAIAAHAPVAAAELVALAPEAAFADFPAELPIPGFDPDRHLIEAALRRGRLVGCADHALDTDFKSSARGRRLAAARRRPLRRLRLGRRQLDDRRLDPRDDRDEPLRRRGGGRATRRSTRRSERSATTSARRSTTRRTRPTTRSPSSSPA